MTETLPSEMHVSDALLKKLFAFEGKGGLQPDGTWHAYRDVGGVPTIYYGLTKGVKMGMVLTDDEAKKMLNKELATYELAIAREVKVPLSQSRFDAAFDFTYNCGEGALAKCVKASGLNNGRYDAFPAQIMQYTHYRDANTKRMVESSGLRRRRVSEVAMWNHVDAEIKPVEGETMPQAPVKAPVLPAVASAVVHSWTVRGTALSVLGLAGHAAEKATGTATSIAQDIQTQVDQAGPFRDLAGRFLGNAEWITLGLVGVGLLIVLARRLTAAAEQKIG